MTAPSATLRQLWEAMQELPYPHGRPEGELGSADFGDLMELDATVAGYITRVVAGGVLKDSELQHLARLSTQARAVLPELSGETRIYFNQLAELSRFAEEEGKATGERAN